jgi:hypothetical protein
MTLLKVTYMELREPPALPTERTGPERVTREHPKVYDVREEESGPL